ncbi:MAG: hypothetical protein AB8B69_06955 [Chitinophagales bacterium]
MKTNGFPKGTEVACFNYSHVDYSKTKNEYFVSSSLYAHSNRLEIVTCSDDDFSSNIDIALLSFLKLYEQLDENNRSKVCLTIVLTSAALKFIKALVASMNLADCTRIINLNNSEEVKKACNRAHLFLNPARNNQMDFVHKALQKGIPVICFESYWTRNIINSKCGFRIPFNHLSYCKNIDAFSAHLYTLSTNPCLLQNLSIGAKERYTELFGQEKA